MLLMENYNTCRGVQCKSPDGASVLLLSPREQGHWLWQDKSWVSSASSPVWVCSDRSSVNSEINILWERPWWPREQLANAFVDTCARIYLEDTLDHWQQEPRGPLPLKRRSDSTKRTSQNFWWRQIQDIERGKMRVAMGVTTRAG